jgi:hypothetical protein
MLLHAYLPKLITALFGGLFIAAGVLTFGNALIFDRLYIGILIFTAIICRKNINVVGIIVILLIERIIEELLWFSFVDHFYNLWTVKILVYTALGFMLYKLWYDTMAKVALPCLLLSIGADLYWYVIEYANAPGIYWYNIIIAQSLLVRYLLFSRIELTEDFFKMPAESSNLDWFIYQITRLYIIIQALNISEYLLRHSGIERFSHIQIIYNIYPYLIHLIGTFTLWILFNEVNKILEGKLLKA